MLVYVRPSNEAEFNSKPAFSEATGVVSTGRIERPRLYCGGSSSTKDSLGAPQRSTLYHYY